MHNMNIRLLITCIFSSVFLASLANAHPPEECNCGAHDDVEILPDAVINEVEANTNVEIEVEQAAPSAPEVLVETEIAELATEEGSTEVVAEEETATETLNPEYYGENGLPIYTVQVIAVDHKRKAPVRARVVPKFYGPAEIIVENSNNPKRPVYSIIAGRFVGYTPAKEAAAKLCEPIFLNGCFVRRWEDVDTNRWIDPNAEKPAE